MNKYPDLQECVDRWGNKYLLSESSVSRSTGYEIRRGCGCCPDAIIWLYPFVQDGEYQIYTLANRCRLGVNENFRLSYINYAWKNEMQQIGLNPQLIEHIESEITTMQKKADEDRQSEIDETFDF